MTNYSLKFTPNAYLKYWLYVDKASGEISGLGHTTFDAFTNSFIVDELALLEQTNGGANTVMSGAGLSKFMTDLAHNGGNPAEWRLWWHSHVDMPAFWSQTDTNTIDDFNTEQTADNYFISLVGNKKREYKTRLDVYAPVRFTIDNLGMELVAGEELEKQVTDDMTKKIIIPPPSTIILPATNNKHGIIFKGGKKGKKNPIDTGDDDMDDEGIRELILIDNLRTEYYGTYKDSTFTPFEQDDFNDVADLYGKSVAWQVFYKGQNGKYYPHVSATGNNDYNILD